MSLRQASNLSERTNSRYLLHGNGGNGTLALLQWIIDQGLTQCSTYVSIDTGFADQAWLKRLTALHDFATQHQIKNVRLNSKPMVEWVSAKRCFPTLQSPWCAGVLKGLVINDYLDENDPAGEWIVVLSKRRVDSRGSYDLPEWIERNRFFDQRATWHPLYNLNQTEYHALIARTGFDSLSHRSLECQPCIYDQRGGKVYCSEEATKRLQQLEQDQQQWFFGLEVEPDRVITSIQIEKDSASTSQAILNQFDHGCGAPYGCGL